MLQKIDLDTVVESLDFDFTDIHKNSLIDVNEQIKRQPIALSIGEYNYKGNYYPIPFGSYGDFSCIVGASKSKKTFLKSALIASYIGGNSNRYFPDIKGHNTSNKIILDIDTEQSKYHTQKVAKRVCNMVGSIYSGYKCFTVREHDVKTRFQFIEWLILESEYKGNIGLISIDGSADLLDNVNDLETANKIAQSFMKWTTLSNAHLITILHKNFGSSKPTGHLGSAILKKAETVVFVEREDDITKVSCEYSRNVPFEDFKFTLNEDFLPKKVDDFF